MIGDVVSWFAAAQNWQGPDGVPAHLREHVGYSALAVAVAVVVALPLGLLIGHTGRGTFLVAGLANSLRALPTLGLLTLFVILLAPHVTSTLVYFGPSEAVLALLAIPPILTNAYAGVQNVSPLVRDSAFGMGMTGAQVLWRVEMPCAAPLVWSGIRSASLQCIATATVSAYVSLGGFGRYVVDGLSQQDYPQMAAGALLVAALAAVTDGVLAVVQRAIVSPGVSGRFPGSADPPAARHGSGGATRAIRLKGHVMPRMRHFTVGGGALAFAVLMLAACGGSGSPVTPVGSAVPGGASPGTTAITVGSANFQESVLLADIYAGALKAKGINVTTRLNIGSREVYLPGVKDGSIDLIPEYSGALLQYFDKTATAVSSSDVYAQLRKAVPSGLTVLEQSQAQDKDAVVVTKTTADTYHLTSIADLAPVAGKLTFGGPPEFKTRPDGIPGLAKTYGVSFGGFTSLDAGGPLTVNALKNGQVQAADIFTTDPSIPANGFVVLQDPKNLYTAQNVLPLISSAAVTPAVRDTLNAVSAKLDTTTLTDLDAKVIARKQDPQTVATAWLASVGLG